MTVYERNYLAKEYVCQKIELARSKSIDDFESYKVDSVLNEMLFDLICVKANGFRGVVLTAIVGSYIDSNYDPLNSFYSCNPRSIFENGIWYALSENSIPCGKSDPLNVAKNINELNDSWAKGRRPQKSAQAAVMFLQRLMHETVQSERELLIDYFFFKLVNYAKSIESMYISSGNNDDATNQNIAAKLVELVLSYPESGTIPQLVL
jgi:hypothetical protein